MNDLLRNGKPLVTVLGALLLGFNIAVSLYGSASVKERIAILETKVATLTQAVDRLEMRK